MDIPFEGEMQNSPMELLLGGLESLTAVAVASKTPTIKKVLLKKFPKKRRMACAEGECECPT